jgi:phosphoglycerate dehydrogenase-like enzyme
MSLEKKKVVVLAASWMGEKISILDEAGLEVKVIGDQRPDALEAELPTATALITGLMPITREMMAKAPRLLILAAIGVGYNHIDMPAATDLGIVVTHNPGTNSDAVAEFTFGLILALARRIPHSWELMKSGGWRKPGFWGLELRGKTLGIIGLGRIGSRVSKIGNAFGMNVLAVDPYIKDPDFKNGRCPKGLDGHGHRSG